MPPQYASTLKLKPQVKRRLSSKAEKKRVRFFFFDDFRREMKRERKKIHSIRKSSVRLDGGNIRIYEDYPNPLL